MAYDSGVFTHFHTKCNTSESAPRVVTRLVKKFQSREALKKGLSITENVSRVLDSTDSYTDYHFYILDSHTLFCCQPTILPSGGYLPDGLLEDFIVYIFNRQELLKCFCSFDYYPLTYTAKRLMFIGRHTVLLLLFIVLRSTVIFGLGVSHQMLIVINLFVAHPMKNMSEILFQSVYYYIFIFIGTKLLGASLQKSYFVNFAAYYFLCFLFLLVIMVLLILVCMFSTPNMYNEPYQTRVGLLNEFILEVQVPSFITDLILSVASFVPTFYFSIGFTLGGSHYPLLIVGQRFIEYEHFMQNQYYYYEVRILSFYAEYAVKNSYAKKKGWINDFEDVQLNRISFKTETKSPLVSTTVAPVSIQREV